MGGAKARTLGVHDGFARGSWTSGKLEDREDSKAGMSSLESRVLERWVVVKVRVTKIGRVYTYNKLVG